MSAAESTWTQGGPDGGTVYAFSVDPRDGRTVLAATPGGVFCSVDSGHTWAPSNQGLASIPLCLVRDLAKPEILWAGTADRGAFTSADNGRTWARTSSGLPIVPWGKTNAPIKSIAVDPDLTGKVHIVIDFSLWSSTNGGAGWSLVNRSVTRVYGDPEVPGRLYDLSRGLARSTDGGQTFTAVGSAGQGSFRAMAFDGRVPQTIYAGGTSLAVSRDGGESFSVVVPTGLGSGSGQPEVIALVADPATPGAVWAAISGGGVYRSLDYGANWEPVGPGGPVFRERSGPLVGLALLPGPAGALLAGDSSGVWRCDWGASEWQNSSTGLYAMSFDSVAAIPHLPGSALVVSGERGYDGYLGERRVFLTRDAGQSWTAVDPPADGGVPIAVAVDPTSPTRAWVLASAGVWASEDGGDHWILLPDSPTKGSAIAVAPSNPARLYLTHGKELWRSNDRGVSWTLMRSDFMIYLENPIVDRTNQDELFAGSQSTGVGHSTDSGATWDWFSQGLPPLECPVTCMSWVTEVLAVAIDPSNPRTLLAVTAGSQVDGLFVSTDAGKHWQRTSAPPTYGKTVQFDPNVPGRVFLGTVGDGVWVSRDAGETWQAMNEGFDILPEVRGFAFDSASQTLYAATTGGLFTTTLPGPAGSPRRHLGQPAGDHFSIGPATPDR